MKIEVFAVDYNLPDYDGCQVVRERKRFKPDMRVMLITAYGLDLKDGFNALRQSIYRAV